MPPERPGEGQTWSDPELDIDAADTPDRATTRYTRIELIGAGGMGVVHSALDAELGRVVALKEAHEARLGAGLEREARMTAALDHPGIVTVHDAGRSADGRPWYTMRLVRGESLGALLARETTLAGRLRLVRHVLDAAQAVAWAHTHGTVHRDLKPDNIMIGEMGETQVVDWGLAVPAGSAAPIAGTPQFMSPQQATGAPATPKDDVWSLGAVCFELLAGHPIRTGSAAEVLAHAGDPIPPLPAGVPPELAAITLRALSAPETRYADARELAAELARWIDGRPVLAHRYTPGELLVRAVKAWKAPLLVGAVGLTAFVATLGITTWRTAQQRDRATAAEAQTRHALSTALSAHARAAFQNGAWPEAEVLAAEALLDGEDPEARGVLVGVSTVRRPTLVDERDVPHCVTMQLGPDPSTVLCSSGGAVSLWGVSPPQQLWQVSDVNNPQIAGTRITADTTDGGSVVVLDPADGRVVTTLRRHGSVWSGDDHGGVLAGSAIGDLDRVDADDGAEVALPRCDGNLSDAQLLADGRVLSVCAGGEVLLSTPDGAAQRRYTDIAPFLGPIEWNARRDLIVALTADADLWALPPAGDPWRFGHTDVGSVSKLRTSPDGRYVGVVGSRGGTEVWDVDTKVRVLRLPGIGARDLEITADGDLVELGRTWRRWAIPKELATPMVPLHGGGASVAVAPDGSEAAVGLGVGSVVRWGIGTGRLIETWDCCEGAVKSVVYLPDGLAWIGGTHGAVHHAFDGVEHPMGITGFYRRMSVFEDGTPVGCSGTDALVTPTETVSVGLGQMTELGVSPRRTRMVVVGGSGRARVVTAGTPLTLGAIVPDADAVTATIDDDGSHVYTAGPGGIRAWDASGALLWTAPHPEPYPMDLALSGDARWLAAAGLDGAARIYRTTDGTLTAVLRGHTARLSALAFAVDRPILATTGWDGLLRFWDLSSLDEDAVAAANRARTWWRMDRDAALASVAR